MGTWIAEFLESLMYLSPYLLLDLVAVILALIFWRRHPRVSLLTLVAIGLSVSVTLVSTFILAWLPDFLFPNSLEQVDVSPFEQRMIVTRVILMIRNVLGAVAYAFLLAAVFVDRSGRNRVPTGATDPASARIDSERQRRD
jgi:hypothetical protein